MKNIIDHLWQFQVNEIRIDSIVIKIVNQTPKIYFYSQKQKRILRKKQQNIQTALKNLVQQEDDLFLSIEIKQNIAHANLIGRSQLQQSFSSQMKNVLLTRMNKKKSMIVQCAYKRLKSKIQVKKLIHYDSQNSCWSTIQSQIDRYEQRQKILKQYMQNLCQKMQKKIKNNSECIQIVVILSCDFQLKQINLIWCNRLTLDIKSFFQIDYMTKPYFFQQQPAKKKSQQTTYKNIYDFNTKQAIKMANQQCQKIKLCSGCQNQSIKNDFKQVSNDQVIFLRRKNQLSIIGILDEDLPVCFKCYNQLQEKQQY